MRLLNIYAPEAEKIVCTDILLAVVNSNRRSVFAPRVVILACGHRAITKNRKRMICPRCTEMLKRSLADGSEDYESFRDGRIHDSMEWEQDPCRRLNEGRTGD